MYGEGTKKWYVIADGKWHPTLRYLSWQEIEPMWKRTRPEPKQVVKTKEVKRYTAQGSKGNHYEISEEDGVWTCSCPAHGFGRGKDCKHIKEIKSKS